MDSSRIALFWHMHFKSPFAQEYKIRKSMADSISDRLFLRHIFNINLPHFTSLYNNID
jgi:hypothetical protein